MFLLLLLCTETVAAQNNYDAGMKKAFSLWDENKTQAAVQLFERIASAEPTEWLPNFYASQILVFSSFNEKDKAKLTATLSKALDLMNMAKTNSEPNNAEIMVLEAQYYTAWVVFDGQQFGMKYAGRISEIYQKAAAIAPNNPRVAMGKAEWEIGSAEFFGGDVSLYCDDIDRAITLFKNFTPISDLHPSGGLAHALEVKEQKCRN